MANVTTPANMKWFFRIIRVVLAMALLQSAILAQETSVPELTAAPEKSIADPKINEKLAELVKEHKIPSIVAGIVHGSELIAVGAAGIRKLGSNELITVDDKMHLGSCTKAMTATRIAMLVEEGKLDWDSTLASVFPEEMGTMHPEFHDVTLTQLLTHRASVPANISWILFKPELEWLGPKTSIIEKRLRVLRLALKDKPRKPPGTAFQYSNVGFVLAGAMAERVTGQSWEELMQDGLFQPLGMATAGFGPPGTQGRIDQPWGHVSLFGIPIPEQEDNVPALGPAGVVHVSIPDWAKFAALHLQGARGNATLVKPETFIRLQTPPENENYAMGWVVQSPEWASTPGFWHNGSNTMWYSLLWIFPEKNVALLAVTNQFNVNACDDAVRFLLEYFETELLQK